MKETGIKRYEDYTENCVNPTGCRTPARWRTFRLKVTAGEGAVLKMGDKVLVTDHAWKGFIAGVYEFIETPEETGYSYIECRLNLIAMSAELSRMVATPSPGRCSSK